MELVIKIPDYKKEEGLKVQWESGFIIETKYNDDKIVLKANKEGLISLATHMLALANEEIPSGYHIHYDETNSLEKGSLELIIEKC